MPVTDDESTRIDVNALAGALAEKLNLGGNKETVDEVGLMIQAMRGQQMDDAEITKFVLATNAANKKMERTLQEALSKHKASTLQQNRDFLSSSELNRALRDLYKHEPELKPFDKAIKAEASEVYFSDPKLAAAWNEGSVDFDKMQSAIDNTADKFLKFAGKVKEPDNNPAADPGKSAKKAASEEKEVNKQKSGVADDGSYNLDELPEYQQAAFLAAKHGNRKFLGEEDPVKASKEAWEFAKSLPKPSHRGTRVAYS